MALDAIVEWRTIGGYENYEVSNDGQVRNQNGAILSAKDDGHGHLQVSLYKAGVGKTFKVHKLVATTFLGDSEGRDTDHCDRNRRNNNVSNLRYVSRNQNLRNRSACGGIEYSYVSSLPEDAVEVSRYGRHEFEDLYYHDGTFYLFTGLEYRIIPILRDGKGHAVVRAQDTTNSPRQISLAKYRRSIGDLP
jgi:hypothetical protein